MKKLIKLEEVCVIARMSAPTIYRKIKAHEFPRPIKVPTTATRGPKLVNRWDEDVVLNFMLAQNMKKARQAEVIIISPPVEEMDEHWDLDQEPWHVKHKYPLMAAVGGLLAGLGVGLFG